MSELANTPELCAPGCLTGSQGVVQLRSTDEMEEFSKRSPAGKKK
ncbi:MAG TPA: hypothetical protein VI564_09275 [Candidatus Nanoarchaeia archaeon]|nr:hypothetical protein [Candidatus Nanoarchaeia archaeon]